MKPTSLAISASLLLSAIFAGICELLFHFSEIAAPWYFGLVLFLISFMLLGLTFRILYRRYVFSSLNQIYKNIVRLRYPNEPLRPFGNQNTEIAEGINRILVDWSNESREEIDHLKQIENYRREFLSNVSHELKTPIFSIQGYVHTLIDGGIEDHDINVLYLNKASRSIDRLINIVDDLESISKLEAGELPVEQRTFDINDLTKDVIESLEFQSKEKNVKVAISANSERPHYVFADRDLIRQVLVNLIVNSIKYGSKDGKTEIRFTDADDKIIIDVEDDGIGIQKQHLSRLFERFYRVDKSRSREQGGTGLGLAIVKHIIEAHHQQISVNSEIGKGTIFSFSLKKSK
jgi:two-component system, OmpR family, phosphate regulon sensor histidine kinase PhoR